MEKGDPAPSPRPALGDEVSSLLGGGSHPDWVMLDCYVRPLNGDDMSLRATLAEGKTSAGERICFAFKVSAPPKISRFYFDWQHRDVDFEDAASYYRNPVVKAAHRNSVLLSIAAPDDRFVFHDEYFVYQVQVHKSAITTTLRMPPPCGHHFRSSDLMGILCRDDLDFILAHLRFVTVDTTMNSVTANLCIRKQGRWTAKQLPVFLDEDICKADELCLWETNQVVPYRNFICWVDYLRGIIFCDVLSRTPTLKYFRFPVKPHLVYTHPDDRLSGPPTRNRCVCVTKDGAMKFVDVTSRASCVSCSEDIHSSPFVISSWILSDQSSHWDWNIECTIRADEFWSHTEFMNLPRAELQLEPELPLVNMEDPRIMYFLLRKIESSTHDPIHIKAFLIAVGDTADACIQYTLSHPGTLLDSPLSEDADSDTTTCNLYFYRPFISSEFSKYLNACDTRKRKILG